MKRNAGVSPAGQAAFRRNPARSGTLPGQPAGRRRSAVLVLLLLAVLACRREQRELRRAAPASDRPGGVVRLAELQPGQPWPEVTVRNVNEERAYDLAEGKRLYIAYNCVGCHSHGGGGIGPPLMDEFWIYGSHPENIHDTIVEGRPNGMPSYGGKLPDHQVWQITAYVRSMSGLAPKPASPGRADHMTTKVVEQSKKEESERR